jgi:hypothetical protein
MQAQQQMIQEIRRLKYELDKRRVNDEEVREELNQMTRRYLMTKQERDRFYSQI